MGWQQVENRLNIKLALAENKFAAKFMACVTLIAQDSSRQTFVLNLSTIHLNHFSNLYSKI